MNSMQVIKKALHVILFLVFVPLSGQAVKVACVGNSITYGFGLDNREQQSYPAVLQSLLGNSYTVGNFGTNGCTMLRNGNKPYWTDPNFKAATDFNPDIVIIMLGTNDAKPFNWVFKDQFMADYLSLIEHFGKMGAKVYIGIPAPVYGNGNFSIDASILNNEVVPLIRQVAEKAGAPFIDVYKALSGRPDFFPDTVHPNADGASLIAKTVFDAISISVNSGKRF